MTVQLKPDVVTTVRLLSAAEGGRHSSTPSDFLGCILEINNQLFECRLLLDRVGSVAPGEEANIPIKFLSAKQLAGLLTVGRKFNLREGGTKIGEGIINEVLA